jgi:hypothetical protein
MLHIFQDAHLFRVRFLTMFSNDAQIAALQDLKEMQPRAGIPTPFMDVTNTRPLNVFNR